MSTILWLSAASLAAFLVVLFILSYRSYRRERKAALTRLPAGSHMFETAYGPVEYATRGTGPVVLISHGIMGGYDQGLVFSQVLGAGLACIAPSRFGYLRSSLPVDAGPAAQADAYAGLLDALGIRRAVILGGSAGGPSAVQFALRHPDRCAALVLASSTTRAGQKVDPLSLVLSNMILHLEYLFWLTMRAFPQVMLNYCGVTPALQAHLAPAEMEWVRQLLSTMQPVGPRRKGIMNDIRQIAALQLGSLQEIRVPTLVTHAKDDRLVPVAYGKNAAQSIPGAQLILMESGGHFCVGNQEAFEQVIEFLQKQLG